jgi:protein-S-isoprenylcysteine O-methyltransferase Ste14
VLAALAMVAGVALIAAGFALWVWTVRLFAVIGEGTLAPWDATRHLVVERPYCHVRNPMITAVLVVLIGESSLFGSVATLIWSAVCLAVNSAYFVVIEEPGLARRFGGQHRAYRANVPRGIPRRTPGPPTSTNLPESGRSHASAQRVMLRCEPVASARSLTWITA